MSFCDGILPRLIRIRTCSIHDLALALHVSIPTHIHEDQLSLRAPTSSILMLATLRTARTPHGAKWDMTTCPLTTTAAMPASATANYSYGSVELFGCQSAEDERRTCVSPPFPPSILPFQPSFMNAITLKCRVTVVSCRPLTPEGPLWRQNRRSYQISSLDFLCLCRPLPALIMAKQRSPSTTR